MKKGVINRNKRQGDMEIFNNQYGTDATQLKQLLTSQNGFTGKKNLAGDRTALGPEQRGFNEAKIPAVVGRAGRQGGKGLYGQRVGFGNSDAIWAGGQVASNGPNQAKPQCSTEEEEGWAQKPREQTVLT